DLSRENMQPVRGWTDEAWDDALARLAARGWVDGADGDGGVGGDRRDGGGGVGGDGRSGGLTLTGAGRDAHAAVENATDWAAARPWARLGPEVTAEIAAALAPISAACASVLPFPSPIGLPAPRAAG